MSFKVGDVARLKSGGPTMTVSSAGGHEIQCTWFVDGERKTRNFSEATLVGVAETSDTHFVGQRVYVGGPHDEVFTGYVVDISHGYATCLYVDAQKMVQEIRVRTEALTPA